MFEFLLLRLKKIQKPPNDSNIKDFNFLEHIRLFEQQGNKNKENQLYLKAKYTSTWNRTLFLKIGKYSVNTFILKLCSFITHIKNVHLII